jgi:hypothetical protein
MEAMQESLCIAILSQTRKNAMFFLLSHVFSSTKLEKKAEWVLPGSEGDKGRRAGRRGGPNNVYTYE